jgi:REP element-mobilizing transposase RayT
MGPKDWLLTFCCYGNWLPGDRRGYVAHAPGGGTYRGRPSDALHAWVARRLPRPPFLLDAPMRAVVEAAIRDQCAHAGWALPALHVRTNHVHVVVSGAAPPGLMMNLLKSWATRRLREAALIGGDTRPWARHGSTVPLRSRESVEAACRYVVDGQGAPLG